MGLLSELFKLFADALEDDVLLGGRRLDSRGHLSSENRIS